MLSSSLDGDCVNNSQLATLPSILKISQMISKVALPEELIRITVFAADHIIFESRQLEESMRIMKIPSEFE